MAQAANQSSEYSAASNAQQKVTAGASTVQRSVRRAQAAAKDAPVTQAPSNANVAQAIPFQAVLGELMPSLKATSEDMDTASAGRTALSPSLAKATSDTKGNATLPTVDPAFQITKEGAHTGADAALSQRLADAQEAFSARVVENAGAQAPLNVRDPQSAIAASRFDSARTAANTTPDQQTAADSKKSDAANPPATPAAKTTQPAQAADSGASSDANANSDSDQQQRDADTPVVARTEGAQDTEATTPQTAQAAPGSLPVPAPVAGNTAGVHTPSPVKTTAEPGTPQLPEPQGEPGVGAGDSVHNISLRLTNADQSAVQVRLSERAGELHVSVRTPDVSLTRGLRDGLPDLMGKLQINGYKAETWQPGGNGNWAGQDRGQDTGSQQQQRNGNGSGSQGQQQNSQNQQQDEQTPQWVGELETSIQRSNNSWQPAR